VLSTTIATMHEEIVTPCTSEALAGPANQVTNVVIQKFCPLDPIEHDQTPNDPVVQRFVLAAFSNTTGRCRGVSRRAVASGLSSGRRDGFVK